MKSAVHLRVATDAPGASGNASAGDLACMLSSMSVDTGMDMEARLNLRAGLPNTFKANKAAIAA
jgi:hypothetical protein